ncbi:MAG: FxsA family protein [Thermoleophilia bacterium]|nr:FxsA family protein [Thermoleophilia bacterium]
MFMILLALFIVLPLLELWMIIEVGSRIGAVYTVVALILISVAGAALARQQGYRVIGRVQTEIQSGQMPGDSLVDGAIILTGALLLLTPGFLTDIVGLLLLLPFIRIPVRSFAKRRLKKAIERRSVFDWTPSGRGGTGSGNGPNNGESQEPEQRRKELGD